MLVVTCYLVTKYVNSIDSRFIYFKLSSRDTICAQQIMNNDIKTRFRLDSIISI